MDDEYESVVFDLTTCTCTHDIDSHGTVHCDVPECHCEAHWVD